MTISKSLVAGSLIAVIGAGALPAVGQAETTTTTTVTKTYNISVDPAPLAGGADHVRAKVVVRNPERSVSDWYSRATVKQVVRRAVDRGIQKPFNYQGYRCVPVLDGSMNASTAYFTCKLNGADVPTTVKLTFKIPFLPPTA
jgi:hypothetical protein